jgi:hypothetical protein
MGLVAEGRQIGGLHTWPVQSLALETHWRASAVPRTSSSAAFDYNGDFGAAKMRFDEGEERREGGMCSNGLPDLLSTWRA